MKKAVLLAVIVAVTLAVACRKEKSAEGPAPSEIVCDYGPYKAGSIFEFEFTRAESADTLQYAVVAIGDTTIESESYSIIIDQLNGIYFRRCEGGDYYDRFDAVFFPGVDPQTITTTYIKESVPRGGTWSEDYQVNIPGQGEVAARLTYTVIQKGTNKTVLGKVYTNVIGLSVDLSVPGVIDPVEIYKEYYAKGVGVIERNEGTTDTIRLKSYTIL